MLYKKVIRPICFRIDPEVIHNLVIGGLRHVSNFKPSYNLVKNYLAVSDPSLSVKIGSLNFDNPVGLAAGFDKEITAPLAYDMLGFGFAELGSITYKEQPGNPRPRLWRLPADSGLIVYYGLSNAGAEKTAVELSKILNPHRIPYGVSIAPSTGLDLKDMVEDYISTLAKVNLFADYITLNVSCPNVAGCEKFAQVNFIKELIQKVRQWFVENKKEKEVFLKIGPHFTPAELDQIIGWCLQYGITGLVATNLIKDRTGVQFNSTPDRLNHPGGISGKILKNRSNDVIKYIYQSTQGKLDVIGLGGVFNAGDAYEKIKLGASVIQIITGFIYEGPFVIKKINTDIIKLLKSDGFNNISEARGVSV